MSTLQSEIIRHFIEPMMERDAVMSEATSNDIYIYAILTFLARAVSCKNAFPGASSYLMEFHIR